MAILMRGKTKCGICKSLILDGQDVTSFPPVILNHLSPLFFFSDSSFHSKCFQAHPLSPRLKEKYDIYLENSGRKTCQVCGEKIISPDDFFGSGDLESDEFNYFVAHLNCLSKWPELESFKEFLCILAQSGTWAGPSLNFLQEKIRRLD